MAKANPLAQALNQSRNPVAAPTPDPLTARRTRRGSTGSRSGRVLIGGHYTIEVQRTLKIIAAEEGTTVQALLAEGINTVLAKRGKPEIADLYTSSNV